MIILDLLKKRRSYRNFKYQPIPREVLDSILEAGRLSPSRENNNSYQWS